MRNPGRQRTGNLRLGLAGFQRANDAATPPGSQNTNDELSGVALRKTDRSDRVGSAFAGQEQLTKSPAAGSRTLDEGQVVGLGVREATPTVVEHCQLGTPPLGWIASSNDTRGRDFT